MSDTPDVLRQAAQRANLLANRFNYPEIAAPHWWYAVGELAGDLGAEHLRQRGLHGPAFVDVLRQVCPPDSEMQVVIGQLPTSPAVRIALQRAGELAAVRGEPLDGRHLLRSLLRCDDPRLTEVLVRLREPDLEMDFSQPALVRGCALCVTGNPFRPVSADPSWLTSTVVTLARGLHNDRAFDRLPILADALQDAGCANGNMLAHCHGDRPHVRGCWVVDLVLRKE
jgi:hypothetical protein